MAIYNVGNMWDRLKEPHNEIFLVTTNNVLKTNGELVMGAGVAKQATLRFPKIAFIMGETIRKLPTDYNFFILDEVPSWNTLYGQHIYVGAIQTKRHYRDNSDIELVRNSIKKLNEFANTINTNINCPLPGVGLGGLKAEVVKKLTNSSPNNVKYWTLP